MTENEKAPRRWWRPGFTPTAIIDHANQDTLNGWALHPAGLTRIEVHVDGRCIGTARQGLLRADVGDAFPDVEGAAQSGFVFVFEEGFWSSVERPSAEVTVVGVAIGGDSFASAPAQVTTVALPDRYGPDPDAGRSASLASPFPVGVTWLLERELGKKAEDWERAGLEEAIQALGRLEKTASRETRGLFRYFSFLREIWARIDGNQRYFPARNRSVGLESKDAQSIASGGLELFVICHHLATLRSHGVPGSVCEFGCFKGFSTSVLSTACQRLGYRLDVFDSFEGLPPSASDYYDAGDFAGSESEVRANVTEFGEIDAVRFHKGFFSESLVDYAEPQIACAWMDVDLEVSARDAMQILPRLDRRSGLFSDECAAEDFVDGEIGYDPDPDRVVEPVVDAFRADGRGVAGRYLCGHAGWFYDPSASVPVLGPELLIQLRDTIL